MENKLYSKLSKAMTKQDILSEAPDRAWQADVDALLLKDRIAYCRRIKPTIGKLFADALVASNKVAAEDFLFAPPKTFPRSNTKLGQ